MEEVPVRDVIYDADVMNSSVPERPAGIDASWELQYCQWSGWTWVKKDKNRRQRLPSQQNAKQPFNTVSSESKKNHNSKGKGKLCGLFAKKETPRTDSRDHRDNSISSEEAREYKQMANQSQNIDVHAKKVSKKTQSSKHNINHCEMCCCCCTCSYIPPCCCCVCEDDFATNKQRGWESEYCSKRIQTQPEVKEKATKMSEVDVSRNRVIAQYRRCTCCPCKRRMSCNGNKSEKSDNRSQTHVQAYETNPIVNWCLTSNRKFLPTKVTKPTYFSALDKSVEILLKNNINIASLINEKQFNFKAPYNFFNPMAFTPTECVKKPDFEHKKLLSDVCDAILSSHKFDNVDIIKNVTTRSSHNSFIAQSSHPSVNKHFMHSILGDAGYPNWANSEDHINTNSDVADHAKSTNEKINAILQKPKKINQLRRSSIKLKPTKKSTKLESKKCTKRGVASKSSNINIDACKNSSIFENLSTITKLLESIRLQNEKSSDEKNRINTQYENLANQGSTPPSCDSDTPDGTNKK